MMQELRKAFSLNTASPSASDSGGSTRASGGSEARSPSFETDEDEIEAKLEDMRLDEIERLAANEIGSKVKMVYDENSGRIIRRIILDPKDDDDVILVGKFKASVSSNTALLVSVMDRTRLTIDMVRAFLEEGIVVRHHTYSKDAASTELSTERKRRVMRLEEELLCFYDLDLDDRAVDRVLEYPLERTQWVILGVATKCLLGSLTDCHDTDNIRNNTPKRCISLIAEDSTLDIEVLPAATNAPDQDDYEVAEDITTVIACVFRREVHICRNGLEKEQAEQIRAASALTANLFFRDVRGRRPIQQLKGLFSDGARAMLAMDSGEAITLSPAEMRASRGQADDYYREKLMEFTKSMQKKQKEQKDKRRSFMSMRKKSGAGSGPGSSSGSLAGSMSDLGEAIRSSFRGRAKTPPPDVGRAKTPPPPPDVVRAKTHPPDVEGEKGGG